MSERIFSHRKFSSDFFFTKNIYIHLSSGYTSTIRFRSCITEVTEHRKVFLQNENENMITFVQYIQSTSPKYIQGCPREQIHNYSKHYSFQKWKVPQKVNKVWEHRWLLNHYMLHMNVHTHWDSFMRRLSHIAFVSRWVSKPLLRDIVLHYKNSFYSAQKNNCSSDSICTFYLWDYHH